MQLRFPKSRKYVTPWHEASCTSRPRCLAAQRACMVSIVALIRRFQTSVARTGTESTYSLNRSNPIVLVRCKSEFLHDVSGLTRLHRSNDADVPEIDLFLVSTSQSLENKSLRPPTAYSTLTFLTMNMTPMRRQKRMSTFRMIALSSSAEKVARNAARASGSWRKSRDVSSSAERSVEVIGAVLPFSIALRSSATEVCELTATVSLPNEVPIVKNVCRVGPNKVSVMKCGSLLGFSTLLYPSVTERHQSLP